MAASLEKVRLHLLSKRSGDDSLLHLGGRLSQQSRWQGILNEVPQHNADAAPAAASGMGAAATYPARQQPHTVAVDNMPEPSRPSSRQLMAQGSFGTWGRRESLQGTTTKPGEGAAAAAAPIPEAHAPVAQSDDDFGLQPSGSKHREVEAFPILWPKVSTPSSPSSEAAPFSSSRPASGVTPGTPPESGHRSLLLDALIPPSSRPVSGVTPGTPPDSAQRSLLLSGIIPSSPSMSITLATSHRGEAADALGRRRRSSAMYGRSSITSLGSQDLSSSAAQELPLPETQRLPSPEALGLPLPAAAAGTSASSHSGGLQHMPSLPPRRTLPPAVNPGLWLSPPDPDNNRTKSLSALSPSRLQTGVAGRTGGSNPLLPPVPLRTSHNAIVANLAATHKSAWESMGRKWFTRKEESTDGSSSNDGGAGGGEVLAPVPERQ